MINADQKNPKKPQKYNCIICMLNTCNKKDYERHLSTVKHKKREKYRQFYPKYSSSFYM